MISSVLALIVFHTHIFIYKGLGWGISEVLRSARCIAKRGVYVMSLTTSLDFFSHYFSFSFPFLSLFIPVV